MIGYLVAALALLWQASPTAELTRVDFFVTTADGTPVPNVAAADITIKIDGKTREIRSLRLVSVSESPRSNTESQAAPLPAPFGTNALTSDGRSLVLAIDEDSFRAGREQPLREAVDGLIANLGPRDRVLVVTLPFGRVKVPFTTDHAQARRAVAATTGQRPQAETGSEMACRTRRVLEVTAGFLDLMKFAQGPTSVVFFTGGMAGPRRDAVATLAPGMCELTADHFARLARAAGAARANFYVVHPDDMAAAVRTESIAGAGFTGSDNPYEGIEHLAGVTGGRRLPLSAAGPTALVRVVRETSAYYVADLTPDRNDRDGRNRLLNIRSTRPDVVVAFRPQIAFGAPRPAAPAPESAGGARQMLLSSAAFPDVPLRTAAYTSFGTGGKVKVVALAEPGDATTLLGSVMAALVDGAGRVIAQWTAPDPTEIPLSGAMLVDPGQYRLRMAATDKAGHGGAADFEFEAALTNAGTLKLSSLILGMSRGGVFVPKLQFANEPVALATLEFSGQLTGQRLTIGLEVARTIEGALLVSTPLAVERLGDDHYSATGALPIGALQPGDYVVRAVVTVEGQPPARVMRTLRKVQIQ
jgi:VWFA-related protein